MSVFRENTDQDLEECLNILCDCIEAVKHSLQKERSFFDARLAKLTRERDEARAEVERLRAALAGEGEAKECWCQLEAGDSPCPTHGMDEEKGGRAAIAKAKEEMQHLKQQRTP